MQDQVACITSIYSCIYMSVHYTCYLILHRLSAKQKHNF